MHSRRLSGVQIGLSLFYVAVVLSGVNAQHTEAVCNVSSLSWSFNSLGQSPCLVAAYMGNPCSQTGNFDVPAIGPGYHYDPPDLPSPCDCSTITYSLLSVCAACQGADIGPWTDFSQNCTRTSIPSIDGQYPFAIPDGTAVPAWAFQLVQGSNRFNITLAKSVGDTPENVTTHTTSSPPPSSTSTSQGSSFTPPPGGNPQTSASVVAPGPTQTRSPEKNHTGVIAGSVVGGVVGLAAIGAVLAYFLMRDRNRPTHETPSVAYADSRPMTQYSTIGSIATPSNSAPSDGARSPSFHPPPSTSPSGHSAQPSMQSYPMPRPYNPDDPTTFPVSPPQAPSNEPGRLAVY